MFTSIQPSRPNPTHQAWSFTTALQLSNSPRFQWFLWRFWWWYPGPGRTRSSLDPVQYSGLAQSHHKGRWLQHGQLQVPEINKIKLTVSLKNLVINKKKKSFWLVNVWNLTSLEVKRWWQSGIARKQFSFCRGNDNTVLQQLHCNLSCTLRYNCHQHFQDFSLCYSILTI